MLTPRNQLAEFLDSLPFQQYVTLTYGPPTSVSRARATCSRWINLLERRHRSRIGVVSTIETFQGRHAHHHLLLICAATLDEQFERNSWHDLSSTRSSHAIDIQAYDPTRGALSYVLKRYGSDSDEIELQALEFFVPHPVQCWTKNAKQRRRWRRMNCGNIALSSSDFVQALDS